MNLIMQEYFWSIAIEQGSIQAAIWTIKENAAHVVAISNPSSWENDESLVTACDYVLSSCVQDLNIPASNEPTKTVFGVPPYWVSDGQIERAHLDKIRLICNKLSLNPSGFVVMPEAIAHFKKFEEKAPISAVIIGVNEQSLDVSVFRLGNLSGTVNVVRSDSVTDDVVEGLARFGTMEPLPSRFLLYSSHPQDLEEVKQLLIQADWDNKDDKVKFLHTPKVEEVASQEKMVAVSLAGGAEIAQVSVVTYESKKETKDSQEKENNVQLSEGLQTTGQGVVDASSLGFVSGGDYREKNEEVPEPLKKVSHVKLPDFKQYYFVAVILIFFILVGGFVAWWFLPKAQVAIIVSAKKIGGDQKIIYDTNAVSIDALKLIVPAKSISTTLSANKTKTASGTKTIGTPSKGSVTFYNVGGAVTIPAGTTLSASNLQFSLDNDVQVASASGAASAATTNGNITAGGVGADYNLASGTFFTVGNYSISTLQAKNSSDLSGGSSQDVVAVSSDDISTLSTQLIGQLTDEGKSSLKTNLLNNNIFIADSIVATPSAQEADHQVGDQAATVKLTLTAKVSGLTVSRLDMNSLAQKIYQNQIPRGYTLKDAEIDFNLGVKNTTFMINLLPNINSNDIAARISGRSIDDAKKILSSQIPGFVDLQVKITPNIILLQSLPHVAQNITVGESAR